MIPSVFHKLSQMANSVEQPATPTQARLEGARHAVEEFGTTIKTQPVLSVAGIGLTLLGGKRFPLVASLVTAALLGYSGVQAVHEEHLAMTDPQKATSHYKKSGEHILSTGLALLGADEAAHVLVDGVKEVKASGSLMRTVLGKPGLGQHQPNMRMWIGLLDDAILPFSWVAKKVRSASVNVAVSDKPAPHDKLLNITV